MKTGKTYIQAISKYAFRTTNGENGEIVGLDYVTNEGEKEELCYKVKSQGYYYYVPHSDVEQGLYKITSESESTSC